MHQKNTMKLYDFPFAEVGVENFKFGQRERHYDSSKTKTFTLLIIVLAALIVRSHGTVAPTSSAVFPGGMVFRVWPHTGMSNRGTAAGNSIVSVVDFEWGIIGILGFTPLQRTKLSMTEQQRNFTRGPRGSLSAGRARENEHLCLEGGPPFEFL
jgi:hypothetical protein